jgi:hypothetical protein
VLNHPILKSALSDVDAAQAQREIARSFFFPADRARSELLRQQEHRRPRRPEPRPLVMLWLKWNIFRGGFDYYRDEETAKQISEAQEIARNTNRQVEAAGTAGVQRVRHCARPAAVPRSLCQGERCNAGRLFEAVRDRPANPARLAR